jgi:hypothetical protein
MGMALPKVVNAVCEATGNSDLNVVCNQGYAQAVHVSRMLKHERKQWKQADTRFRKSFSFLVYHLETTANRIQHVSPRNLFLYVNSRRKLSDDAVLSIPGPLAPHPGTHVQLDPQTRPETKSIQHHFHLGSRRWTPREQTIGILAIAEKEEQ